MTITDDSHVKADSLPPGWRWARLDDVCKVVSGSTPSTAITDYWDGEIPFVTPADLGKLESETITATQRSITKHGLASCSAGMLPVGTVLMSSRAPIGHLAIAGVACCTNQGCKNMIPGDQVDSPFLFYALKLAVPELRLLGSGSTFAEISKTAVEHYMIPLPPLAEQKRIAAILNRQMEAMERARKAVEAQLEAAKALPAAYLREVFESDEAKAWPRKRLGDSVSSYRNGFGRRPKGTEDGPIVLRLADVSNGFISLKSPRRVAMTDHEIGLYSLVPGDLLFVRVNGSRDIVGRCILAESSDEVIAYNDHLIRVRLAPDLLPEYVRLYCDYPSARETILGGASTTAGQLTINQETIGGVEIPMPAKNHQHAVVMRYREQGKQAERASRAIQAQVEDVDALPSALLRRAFRGEL